MAGGLPGSRALIPSSPFGTATPPTIIVPGGGRSASAAAMSAEGARRDRFSPEDLPVIDRTREGGAEGGRYVRPNSLNVNRQ